MVVIACAAKNGGMMFNRRRCSRDRVIISDILNCYPHTTLSVREYSASLFEGTDVNIISNVSVLSSTDIFFLEDIPFSDIKDKTDKLIIYRWDRIYPADLYLEIGEEFKLISTEELVGYSHPKIIKEVYEL